MMVVHVARCYLDEASLLHTCAGGGRAVRGASRRRCCCNVCATHEGVSLSGDAPWSHGVRAQVAAALYEAAVAKFEAVLEGEPRARPVLRGAALALLGLARSQPDPAARATRPGRR